MEQRELDGCRGSEILDKGYMGLLEFTAVIRPAGWSKEGKCSGEYKASVVETDRPGFEFCVLPGSEPVSAVCTWRKGRISLASFLGKQRSGM